MERCAFSIHKTVSGDDDLLRCKRCSVILLLCRCRCECYIPLIHGQKTVLLRDIVEVPGCIPSFFIPDNDVFNYILCSSRIQNSASDLSLRREALRKSFCCERIRRQQCAVIGFLRAVRRYQDGARIRDNLQRTFLPLDAVVALNKGICLRISDRVRRASDICDTACCY